MIPPALRNSEVSTAHARAEGASGRSHQLPSLRNTYSGVQKFRSDGFFNFPPSLVKVSYLEFRNIRENRSFIIFFVSSL